MISKIGFFVSENGEQIVFTVIICQAKPFSSLYT